MKLQNKITSQLNSIRIACKEPQAMDLNPEAWAYFETWGNGKYAQAIAAPPQIQPMYGRLEAHALKLCIIIHLSRHPSELEIDTTSTMAACEYTEQTILKSYRRLVMEELTFSIDEQKLKRVSDLVKNRGLISHRDLTQSTRYKKRELTEVIQTLTDMGRIEFAKGERGGKWWKWTGSDA